MQRFTLVSAATAGLLVSASALANNNVVRVEITNLAPNGGIYLTPVWAGFHNGSFDSYDGGTASATELERLAEDGNTGPISATFQANGTLVSTSNAQVGNRVDGTLGSRPFGPGRNVSMDFTGLDLAAANQYFSYASMILPSSDYYLANGNPTVYDLSNLAVGETRRILLYGVRGDTGGTNVNDAGTEVNDFNSSAGNGFFPGLTSRNVSGQSGPNEGATQGGVNANVTTGATANDPFRDFDEGAGNGAGFLNIPAGFDTAAINFNNPAVYQGRGELNAQQQGVIPAVALIEITRLENTLNSSGGGSLGGLWAGILLLLTGAGLVRKYQKS